MATAIPKITLSSSRDIPFNRLVLSQSNVRRVKSGLSIEELARDIERRGLLQSLNVRPVLDDAGVETGTYEVPAGGRRFRALELLVKQKKLAKTAPVPCVVREVGSAILAEDDSLAENVQRVALHPLDQFRDFRDMLEKGMSEEEIAAAFFVAPAVVRQRLRLMSAVSPMDRRVQMEQSGIRIQWGQVAVVLSMIVLSWWAATEWTAWELAFQPELGRPWFVLFRRWPVYAPPLFFWWWYVFDAYAPNVFARGAWIAGSGGVLAFAAAVALSVHRAREAKKIETYGSARWAGPDEIAQAGLLDPDGVVLGRYGKAYLRHDGPEHVLTFAPTRSGKGVGMVIPTLLTWPGSAIVHDIKGENWELTAGFRARFGRVVLFDPTNVTSAAYNPLLEIRRGEWEVRDAQNVADILVDPEGSLEKRNHWEKTSHSLLVGAILHVLYAEPDKTLAGVANFLSDPKRPIATTLSAMMRTKHLGDAGAHPVVASAARELLNKSPNERSSVLSTAMSFLGLYRDPVVAEVTRRHRIRDGVTPAARHRADRWPARQSGPDHVHYARALSPSGERRRRLGSISFTKTIGVFRSSNEVTGRYHHRSRRALLYLLYVWSN